MFITLWVIVTCVLSTYFTEGGFEPPPALALVPPKKMKRNRIVRQRVAFRDRAA